MKSAHFGNQATQFTFKDSNSMILVYSVNQQMADDPSTATAQYHKLTSVPRLGFPDFFKFAPKYSNCWRTYDEVSDNTTIKKEHGASACPVRQWQTDHIGMACHVRGRRNRIQPVSFPSCFVTQYRCRQALRSSFSQLFKLRLEVPM